MTLYMGELCPAGDVGAKSHPDALLQHLPHRGHAVAQVDVGPGAVGHHHPGPADGGALPGVGVDAVGHHRVVLPQAVFVIGLPILGAVRVQLLHPGDLPPVFRQMGLDIQPPVPGDLPQGGHQLVGTAGGEAGVIMGLTCSKWQPSSQRRVSETDSSVVSWRMPGRALRSIFTLPT